MSRTVTQILSLLAVGMTTLVASRAAEKDSSATTSSAKGPDVPGVTQIRSIEGISEYRLANGLRILLFPDQTKPTVTVNMTVLVGSRHEGYGQTGMAHLLEHMLFKGTPDHGDIPEALTQRGASFNGSTWVDRTNYFETLPTSPENLEFAIRLEADRLVNSYVSAEDLESEMTVVRNEFERGENNPARVLAQQMQSAAYQWHNYGNSTIGNRADIEQVPIKDLQAFYHKYYQPDNVVLIVAGNFAPARALKIIADSFGKIPEPERELAEPYTVEPPQQGARLVVMRRVGDVPLVGAVYHIPAGSHPSYPAIDVLESILTSSPSGRLYEALVKTHRAASVSGAAFSWHDPGLIRFLAEVNTGNDPHAILTTMLEVIESVDEKGVTAEEVERAKRKLLKQRELAAANSTRIAIQLSEWAAMGDWRLYFLYRDRLEKVTVEDVNAVAHHYLTQENRTAGIFLPTKQPQSVPVPRPPADLAAAIGEYEGRGNIAQGEVFEVTPQNIQKRTTRSQLPSGLDTAFLPKQNRGNTVVLRLNLRYGNVESLEGHASAAELLPVLMTRGAGDLSRQEIQDKLDQLGAQLVASGEPGVATFVIKTKHKALPETLELLQTILRKPTLPADQLTLMKQARLASLQQQLNDPQARAVTAVRRALVDYEPGDPRYQPTIDEEIQVLESVTRDEVKSLYEKFLNGVHGELVVVGDFDPETIRKIAADALSGWTSEVDYARLPDEVPAKRPHGIHRIETPEKKNAVYFSATTFPLTSSDPDYPALLIGNYILGGGTLSSRLADRIRQQEGLSYGVGSSFSAQALDPRAVLYIYAITNPENVEKLKQAVKEVASKLLEEGITSEELADAQGGYLQRLQVRWADDAQLAQTLATNLYTNRTMAFQAELEKSIKALTDKEVVAALREYVALPKFFTIIAGDFSEVEEGKSTTK